VRRRATYAFGTPTNDGDPAGSPSFLWVGGIPDPFEDLEPGGRHEIKEATLYATYRRLMKDGLVEAYWGDESQGGRRKYYRITDAGRAVYRRNQAAWALTRDLIDSLLDLDRSAGPRDPAPGRRST
jgi:hypothetical protein